MMMLAFPKCRITSFISKQTDVISLLVNNLRAISLQLHSNTLADEEPLKKELSYISELLSLCYFTAEDKDDKEASLLFYSMFLEKFREQIVEGVFIYHLKSLK